MASLVPYLHPIAGLVTIALALYAARLGLHARTPRADAAGARARHAAIGPWLWAAFVASWLGGVATVRWALPDIEVAASGHFAVGSAIVTLVTAGALLSLRIRVDARARLIHPLLGAAALLLSGVQIFLGLQLLP